MAYEPITVAQFKGLKPQFADVTDDVISAYVGLAQLWVDGSWPRQTWIPAQAAIVCHLMTLDGQGTDQQSQSFLTGAAAFQSIRSGEVTLTRYQKSAESSSYLDWLRQTACGAFFLQLLRMSKGGPRMAFGGVGGAQSGYAKDVPFSPPWGYRR